MKFAFIFLSILFCQLFWYILRKFLNHWRLIVNKSRHHNRHVLRQRLLTMTLKCFLIFPSKLNLPILFLDFLSKFSYNKLLVKASLENQKPHQSWPPFSFKRFQTHCLFIQSLGGPSKLTKAYDQVIELVVCPHFKLGCYLRSNISQLHQQWLRDE